MNKVLVWIAAAAVALLSGCGMPGEDIPEEETAAVPAQLEVYVQMPVIGVMDAVTSKYNRDVPEHTVVFSADTAENIKNEILNGAKCDVVIASDETVSELVAAGAVKEENTASLMSDRYVRVMTNDDEPHEETMLGSEAVYDDVTVIEELPTPATGYSAALIESGGAEGDAAERYFDFISSYKAANVYEWFGFKLK